MPTKKAMRMIIHREIVRTEPVLPRSLNSFTFPHQYTVVGPEQFLIDHYIGNGKENESILVFSTGRNLRLLNNSKSWIVDGTLITCSVKFLHCTGWSGGTEYGAQKIGYGLLSNKSKLVFCISKINKSLMQK